MQLAVNIQTVSRGYFAMTCWQAFEVMNNKNRTVISNEVRGKPTVGSSSQVTLLQQTGKFAWLDAECRRFLFAVARSK
jgi:hypothetical protein